MNENGDASAVETPACRRCGAACDASDNFCRQCGLSLREERLPSVRSAALPAPWRPSVPAAVVRGVAYVAAGKIAELLVRRFVRRALGRTPRVERLPSRRRPAELVRGAMVEEEHFMSETFLLRRTRVRR